MKTENDKPETRGKKSASAYPWDSMAVGGTFYWLEEYSEDEAKRCLSRIQYYQEKFKKKYSMRHIKEGNRIKVWRDA